jgi:hypothetical protein
MIILRCGTVKFAAVAGARVAFVGLRQRPVSRAICASRTRETDVGANGRPRGNQLLLEADEAALYDVDPDAYAGQHLA